MSQYRGSRSAALESVTAMLEKTPLIDGHNDLPIVIRNDAIAKGDVVKFDLRRRHSSGDTDIPRLREGQVSGQVWAAFVPSESRRAAVETLEQIDLIRRMHETYADVFHPALGPDDLLEAKRLGKIASIIAVEGAIGLENSIAPLRIWHAAGVRLVTLCHNGSLDWVDSATDQPRSGGIGPFGREVVREMNRLGMIVDCAHVSAQAMHHVLDVTTAPIVFSHSNARALCDNPRNVPDDVLARIRSSDGMVMATFVPYFISEELRRWVAPIRATVGTTLPKNWSEVLAAHAARQGQAPVATLEQVADHVEYLADKIGPERVGIGSDFWGSTNTPVGLHDVTCFPHLLAELMMRGWSEEKLAGLAGLNFLRIFRLVEAEGQRLRAAELRPDAV